MFRSIKCLLIKRIPVWSIFYFICVVLIFGCKDEQNETIPTHPNVNRIDKLPSDITKRSPQTDQHPPILHSSAYEQPVTLGAGINTSGAEDSPFILPDGNTMYFFFTPDVRVPVEKQLFDSVTGVWVSYKTDGVWMPAVRVWLQEPGKLALDGAVAIQDNEMWFASAREGYTGVNMFTAELVNHKWVNWKYSGDRLMKEIQIGEVHIYGDDLYFHSGRSGGKGSYDIWKTTRNGTQWTDPVLLDSINGSDMDGYPYISSDGNELWFTRTYLGTPAIFKSVKTGNTWSAPELIISQFAGEPTLDDAGNIYFVHHFFESGVMIEADIYVAKKK